MKKILALSLLSLISIPSFSQQTKVLTAEKHNEYGIVYSLPITGLQISVTARKETRKAGPFRQYAKRYLGTSDVISEDAVSWTITGVEVVPVGVRDDETQYIMQLKPGATTYIGVASDGMLLSVNAEPETSENDFEGSVQQEGIVIRDDGGVDTYLKYADMDFVSAQNSMRQAEMIANSLMDVRDAYLSLTRGTADNMPTDGRQLELMLSSLKDQEGAFTRAFGGSVKIEEFTRNFSFIPEEEGEEILFRLSDFNGIVNSDDYSGVPVYIKTEVMQQGELPIDASGQPKKLPKDAIVYGLPGTAAISIYTSSAPLYSAEMEFSQFGTTFGLAPSLFTDKKSPSFARFSPTTGALLEIGKVQTSE